MFDGVVGISDQQRQSLNHDGYVLLPDVMGAALLDRVRTAVKDLYDKEGDQAGSEFKQEPGCRRLANLMNKGSVFQELVAHQAVIPLVREILGPRFKLSSMNARRVLPECTQAQPLHADMAAVPDESGNWVCNTIWMLDDFTQENGAPRVIPGSHRYGSLPSDSIDDLFESHPEEEIITGRAGSVIVMNAHAWHGGMPNHTMNDRTGVHGFYARWDKPQQQYQKGLLDPTVQDSLSQDLRVLLALDDPLNDQLSQADVVRSGFMK